MILELSSVSKSYGSHQILKPTDLQVEDGEFITILGPSGSGKTTILRIVGGFLEPTSGKVIYEGRDIGQLPAHRRPFNTVFQDYALFPHMTVAENVGFGLRVRGQARAKWLAAARDSLELVGLGGYGDRAVSKLSGGQKQRVALARALICQPRIVLLDEPLAALDADLRRQMQVFLKELQRKVRTTFLFVTHDQEEAMAISDRIVLMDVGRIEQVGTPKQLYYAPNSTFVAGFFGENNVLRGKVVAKDEIDLPLGPIQLAADLPVGSTVTVAVRPENIILEDMAETRGITAQCEVIDVSFVGTITKLVVRPDAHPALRLLVKTTSDRLVSFPSPGDVVKVTLPAKHATVIEVPGA